MKMELPTLTDAGKYYPELDEPGLWSADDNKALADFVERRSPTATGRVERRIIETAGGRRFRIVVDEPKNSNGDLLVVPGEFGNGITRFTTRRGRLVRDIAFPDMTVVHLPNSRIGEDNLNLSPREVWQLHMGDPEPFRERMERLIQEVAGDEAVIALLGLSQGAVPVANYLQNGERHVATAGFVEPPNVVDRSVIGLLRDFAGSGAQLRKNTIFGGCSDMDVSPRALTRYGVGLVVPGNIVGMPHVMNRATLEPAIKHALKQEQVTGIGHFWGPHDSVSPHADNQKIEKRFRNNPGYYGRELSGPFADHSMTNAICVLVAVLRAAEKARRAAEKARSA